MSSKDPAQVSVVAGEHAFALQVWVSEPSLHSPPPVAGSMTSRWRCWLPPPHTLLHADQSDHSPNWQSRSQSSWLHTCISTSCGHASPPLRASVNAARVRCWMPPSHTAEHFDHPLHSLTAQSVGQGISSHSWTITRGGHPVPLSFSTITSLVDCRVPLPHVALHAWSTQSVTSQSTGSSSAPASSHSESRTFVSPQMVLLRVLWTSSKHCALASRRSSSSRVLWSSSSASRYVSELRAAVALDKSSCRLD
mmetsp:Transcript_26696/g.69769  ORF Transcript_26696/g.69769 Transcript_26696/m.69769 type:complete len:251 (-) Transcript_26696:841-1593(-)